jgi:DnaJ-class molecular chaperone
MIYYGGDMITSCTTQANQICPACHGNGYVRLKFEAEESIGQCQTCDSQGEIIDERTKK